MNKYIVASALAAAALGLLASPPVKAAGHGRTLSVRGSHGRGFVAQRDVSRSAGMATASRGVQTSGGRGFTTTRNTSHGNGSLTNQVGRTYDNGKTASRTGSVTRNGNGSVSLSRSHTGIAGNTQSGWSTIYRTDDSIGRTRGFTTSSGRSAVESGNVAFGHGSMTVSKSITTGAGASATRSTTYTRGH